MSEAAAVAAVAASKAAGAIALKIKVGSVLIEAVGISIPEIIAALGALPPIAWIGISVIVGGYLGGKIIDYYIEKEKNKKDC